VPTAETRRRVIVFALGGTIAMSTTPTGGVVPALSAEQLIAAVPGLADTDITVEVGGLPQPSNMAMANEFQPGSLSEAQSRTHPRSILRTYVRSRRRLLPALAEFCRTRNLRQGFISSFIAGFSEIDIVGTCDRLDNPQAPVWSKVHLTNVEAFGGGTLAYNPETNDVLPHIHVAVGLKEHSATGYTSHLLTAKVQFLTEMLIIEVAQPTMRRIPQPDLYDVPLLKFGHPES